MEEYQLTLVLDNSNTKTLDKERILKIFSKKVADKILSGHAVKAFSGINLDKAIQLRNAFQASGLKGQIDVCLNIECLKRGTRVINKRNTLLMNHGFLKSKLISLPGVFPSQRGIKNRCYAVCQNGANILPLGRLLLSLVLVVPFYSYLIRFLSQQIEQNILATSIALIFLLMSILFIPQLLRTRLVRTLYNKQGEAVTSLVDYSKLNVNKYYYDLLDTDDDLCARMTAKKTQIVCQLKQENIHFIWDAQLSITNLEDSMKTIGGTVIDGSSLSYLMTAMNLITKVQNFFVKPSRKIRSTSQANRVIMTIMNNDHQPVAQFIQSTEFKLEYLASYSAYLDCFRAMAIVYKERPIL